jgi:hypothetical protein
MRQFELVYTLFGDLSYLKQIVEEKSMSAVIGEGVAGGFFKYRNSEKRKGGEKKKKRGSNSCIQSGLAVAGVKNPAREA